MQAGRAPAKTGCLEVASEDTRPASPLVEGALSETSPRALSLFALTPTCVCWGEGAGRVRRRGPWQGWGPRRAAALRPQA